MRLKKIIIINLFYIIIFHENSFSYVGPGLGLGSLLVVLGVIGSLVLAIISLFYIPIKRFLKKKNEKKSEKTDNDKDKESKHNS